MLVILLILIFIRPFISSLAFPYLNFIYSVFIIGFLVIWSIIKGIPFKKIAFGDNSKVRFSVVRKVLYTFLHHKKIQTPLKYPIFLFSLALIISITFSSNKLNSFKELYKYVIGLYLFLIAADSSQEDKKHLLRIITAAGLIISLLAIYQYFFGFRHTLEYLAIDNSFTSPFVLDYIQRKRVFFPFVTPNTLAGYLAMIIPLTLTLGRKNRIWFIIPLSFALLLTKSLGALLSLFLALGIYFYLPRPCTQERGLQGKLERKKVVFLFGLLIIIGLVFMARATTQKQHLQPAFSTVMRLNYWKETLRIIRISPLTGVGLGNFNLTQSRYAHNSYLQIWAEMGILGIISILWLIIVLFKSTFLNIGKVVQDNQRSCLIAAYTVFLAHNFVDFTFFLPEVAMVWWVISGLILSKDGNAQMPRHFPC